jgi:hypothetical protein
LFLNPGSAGPRRFALPITMALLHVEHTPAGLALRAEHVALVERH